MASVARIPGRNVAAQLAPWPQVDKFPIVIGAMSLQTISSAMRQASSGLRQRWVDILDELLEREPHGQTVLGQRNLTVACGRVEVCPAKTEPGSLDEATAKDNAKIVEEQFDAIDDLPIHLSALLWGNYYGPTALENDWERDGRGWQLTGFNFVHTRRLSYTDPASWDLYLYDGGYLAPRGYGLRLADFPNKFTVHVPRLRGDYPTREGLGRILGFWFSLKGMAVSGGADAIERYAKPWALAYFTTQDNGQPRVASEEDIAAADGAIKALGAGSLSGATLPDSVKVVLERVQGGISQEAFIKLCDAQIGELALGQNQTTELGAHGSRAAISVLKEGTRELLGYDAACLAATLRRDVVRSIIALNRPGTERLAPKLLIHVDRPDPVMLMDLADKGAKIGLPIDADALADMVGLPLVDRDDADARRLAPVALQQPYALLGGTPEEPEPVVPPGGAQTPDGEAGKPEPPAGKKAPPAGDEGPDKGPSPATGKSE